MSAQTDQIIKDLNIVKLNAEIANLNAATAKLIEDGEKSRQETAKLAKEQRWYPMAALITAFIGSAAFAALLAVVITKL